MASRPQLVLVPPVKGGSEASVDPTDLDAVFRRYAPYVARVAMRVLGPRGEVDDLVQDVFLDAHRGLTKLTHADAIKGWLATVTVRKARRRIRRQRLLALVGMETPIDPDRFIDPARDPEERALVTSAYRVLDQVSADARIAWVLRCLEGEPLERVAEVLGVSRATAHRRVTEAQAALQGAFGDG